MGRSRSQTARPPWSGLVAAAVPLILSVTFTLAPARKAIAQAGDTHIVFSETIYDLDGTDRTREYLEFANLGDKDWDPHSCWIYRWAANEGGAVEDQIMIQIAGDGAKNLKPIPPGGVLWVEWGRPNVDESWPAAEGPNVFGTGRPDSIPFQTNDLQDRMAIALFAPQTAPPPFPNTDPNFGGATMLAYYVQGNLNRNDGTVATLGASIGVKRAIALGLWDDYVAVPSGYDWCNTLRWPAPATGHPVPANIGRRWQDYYLTLYGLPDLSIATGSLSDTDVVNPRKGTPGQPNYQFGVPPIPGQTLDDGSSLQFMQVSATAASTPAGAIQIAAVDTNGGIATNTLTGDTWSGWQFVGGPVLGKPVFVDNPKSSSRILVTVDANTGQLYTNRFTASGSQPATPGGWRALGGKVSGAPVLAIDPATGNEAVVANDASGQTTVFTSQNGTFGAPQTLPGNAKLSDLAAAYTPAGLLVLGFDGNQLRSTILDTSGKFSDLANVGAALPNRALIAPVVRFNSVAGQIEVLTAGPDGALQLARVKLGATRADDLVTAHLSAGISTDTTPGMAVNTDTGDVLVIARGADRPIPAGERLNPTRGYARTVMFRNASGKLDQPGQITTGQMPVGASPDAAYNPNTKQFEQFVVGDDNQVYRVTAK
jgi:hypothetical protein